VIADISPAGVTSNLPGKYRQGFEQQQNRRRDAVLEINKSVAVITGGARGIGLALAKYWVERGGKVVLGDILPEYLERAVAAIKGDAVSVVCDVNREEDNARLAQTAIERFGGINLVAPFAGIIKDGLMLSTSRETGKVKTKMALADFQKVVDINLTGVFLTVRECAEQMINHNCRGLADKIRCVAVAPGYCATPILEGMNKKALDKIVEAMPIGRLIAPEEIASLVGELYRNEALAGDVYFIHGGLRLGSRG
jgi:3-oxoacyl-[acyl-carrier protein] reductase